MEGNNENIHLRVFSDSCIFLLVLLNDFLVTFSFVYNKAFKIKGIV
jgi:hypothetical protein